MNNNKFTVERLRLSFINFYAFSTSYCINLKFVLITSNFLVNITFLLITLTSLLNIAIFRLYLIKNMMQNMISCYKVQNNHKKCRIKANSNLTTMFFNLL